MKPSPIIIFVASLAFACVVNAQSTLSNGSTISADENGPVGSSSFTPSSVTLDGTNLILSTTQDFTSLVPAFGNLTGYNITITGLSSSPTSESISDFFVFSTADPDFDASGTTPPNRFEFNLTSITEDYISSSDANFSGTGTLIDITSTYADTPATFSISFSGADDYSFTVEAVPEPTTISLFAAGILGALALRRRKI